MDRRSFLGTLTGGLLAAPLAVEAQPAGKVWRIGFVEPGSSSTDGHFLDAFRQGLRELGYVEGQQIAIEDRWAEGRIEMFPSLLAELIGLNVDVLVVGSATFAVAAKSATTSIPIIFVAANQPVEVGLVARLDRPGGNVTGLSSQSPGLDGKRLALLKEVVPRAGEWDYSGIHGTRPSAAWRSCRTQPRRSA